MPRIRIILQHGGSASPFDPLDRFARAEEESGEVDGGVAGRLRLKLANRRVCPRFQDLPLQPEDFFAEGKASRTGRGHAGRTSSDVDGSRSYSSASTIASAGPPVSCSGRAVERLFRGAPGAVSLAPGRNWDCTLAVRTFFARPSIFRKRIPHPADIELMPREPVPRRRRKSVMVIVPAFAEGQQSHQQIIARGVRCSESAGAPKVRQ